MIWVLLGQYQIPISSISVEPKGGERSCIERERDALLSFKASIEDPSDVLSSWQTGQDCCRWRGVVCSNRTGHVVKLDLHNNFTDINYDYNTDMINYKFRTLGGEISSSLLAIEHLNYLNLSYNDFGQKRIPEFIGSFKNLKYLDLFDAGFGGSIPPQLGNLTKLLYLDLSYNSLESVDYVAWLPRLSSLKYLDMSEVNLSAAVDGVRAMSMLPASLRVLYLFECNLNATFSSLPLYSSNLTSLASLDLGFNYFHGPIPDGLLENMTSLEELGLEGNDLIGMVPETLKNLHNLNILDLSWNQINGDIAELMKRLPPKIEELDLSANNLIGMIPRTLKNLSNLKKLNLWDNQIGGDIAELMKRLSPKIEELYLFGNNLTGSLPSCLEHMTSLRSLDLSNNSLSGHIPSGIGNVTNLSSLDLSSNHFVGIISGDHFASLTKLEMLYLSDNNNLTMVVGPNWLPPFKLKYVGLSSCNLGPHFPTWIRSQTDMIYLAMANSGIVDRLPDWFWNVISSVEYLDLSLNQISGVLPSTLEFLSVANEINLNSNRFQGGVPQLPRSLWLLDLSNNSITGTIPLSMCNQVQSLGILDLSHNRLSGQLPQCLTSRKSFRADPGDLTPIGSELSIVSFRNNSLSGEFPLFFRGCQYLNFLDLSYNNLYGSLPIWIGKRLPQLAFLLLRTNMFSGYIPIQLAKLDYLHVLDLAHNNLSGTIAPSLVNFTAMTTLSRYESNYLLDFVILLVVTKGQALEYYTDKMMSLLLSLDLSSNNLSGTIPQEIGGLATLKNLNLSGNRLTGDIPETIGGLQSLESLDLSNNELYGEIPPTLSALTFLSYLNLSYNNLSGRIPSGQQLQTLDDPSIYEGNNDLCGPPISKNCSGDGTTLNDPLEQEDGNEMSSFYLTTGLGFAVGLWVVIGPLLFKRTWSAIYFLFIDNICDKIYVFMVLNWARLIANIKKK
ncbi:receptor-like protein EIX2 [Typha angustifolia]|uniref:receptor-like protein EIX2 n=1 Tax=Typha angustifolia TaxID=59011 RepID=UPI003C2F7CA7